MVTVVSAVELFCSEFCIHPFLIPALITMNPLFTDGQMMMILLLAADDYDDDDGVS